MSACVSTGEWDVFMARSTTGSANKIIRFRSELPPWANKSQFGALVVITWPVTSADGMPTKKDSKLHYPFEDLLQDAEEVEKAGFLAAVVSGGGKVEWFYYAKTHDEFMAILNKSLKTQPQVPISISLEQDASWSMRKALSSKQ